MGSADRDRRGTAIAAGLVAITLVAYWRVLGCDFVNLDDNLYVYGNRVVREGLTLQGTAWALTTFHAGNWHPLTWASHMLDCQVYGLWPLGHHLTSLVIHLANVVLLFLLLKAATGAVWRSAAVAAVFAVHPLHVESVAWVAERKDVLSVFWGLVVVWMCSGGWRVESGKRRAAVPVAFALALMAKPMMVTLPILLVLLDYWPLRRGWGSGVRGPILVLAAASCLVTFVAQRAGGAVSGLEAVPLGVRVENAVVSYVSYIGNTLWPRGLAAIYPHPVGPLPVWEVAGSAAVLAAVTAFAIIQRARRPYLLVGWLWYLVTLLPVIGLVQVGTQAMADRYTYLPMVGLSIAVVWLIGDLLRGPANAVLALAAVAAMIVGTWGQVGYWRDSVTLLEHAIASTSGNYVAHNNLGFALDAAGKHKEAVRHVSEAIRINPGYPDAHVNLGAMLAAQGWPEKARAEFEVALRIEPRNSHALYGLGGVATQQGNRAGAIEYYRRAIEVQPDYAQAHCCLAMVLEENSQVAEAVRHYRAALVNAPELAEAANNLAWVLATSPDASLRNPPQAVRVARDACMRTGWEMPALIDTLAAACAAHGQFAEAVGMQRLAIKLESRHGKPAKESVQRLELYRTRRAFVERHDQDLSLHKGRGAGGSAAR